MPFLTLPTNDGHLTRFDLSEPSDFPRIAMQPLPRIAYAAAHVVANPRAIHDPFIDVAIDWDKTLDYRRYLWGLGLGVAEAMDTAQRGMGLDWPTSLELIKRSVDAATDFGGNALLACGAGTDHLPADPSLSIDDVIGAYDTQCGAVEALGGRIILMASRALAACAKSPDDYSRVYDHILGQVKAPVIIHWLGEMFDPALASYWGADEPMAAMDVCLDVLADNAAKIDGIKISLLDDQKEIIMRRRLPDGIRMYTGDDFNYPTLIAGDAAGHSDALLGIFDAIAPAASAALVAMGRGDMDRYFDILDPTIALSRHIFAPQTRFYKTGIVFMAYLNGHQDHFVMVGGQQGARSALHLAELFRLADQAGLLSDPDRASARMAAVMATYGIEA
jgi:hypothetical protein